MSNNPDEIRAHIEVTRTELGTNVDALADKVAPSKIAHRQVGKVRDAIGGVRNRVMGSTDDLSDRGAAASDTVADAAHTAKEKVEGNPLAVGLIAFGIGWLTASLIPASEKEKEVASNVKDAAQPLIQEATDAAKDMAENLKQPAQDAAQAVKDSATDAAGDIRNEASSAANDVKEHAQGAADDVRNQ